MTFLLVPVLAQEPSEVWRANREHEGVCRQKLGREKFELCDLWLRQFSSASLNSSAINLMVSAISTSKGDICQLFQLDKLLHKDEERLEEIFHFKSQVFGSQFLIFNMRSIFTWWWSCHFSRNSSSEAILFQLGTWSQKSTSYWVLFQLNFWSLLNQA